jgi:ABC-type branched-subunit amino acid transport system ATPase component/ABC-type branched-subunit amino acid transport system permease subunit
VATSDAAGRPGEGGPLKAELLVGAAVLGALVAPLIAGDQYILHVLIMGGIYAVLTLGLNVINGFAGQLSIGQGAFYGIGAYAAAILTVRAGWPFWLATPTATVLAALIGMLISLPVLRVRGIYLGMATFGFAEIVHVVLRSWDSLTKGVLGISGILPPVALGVDFGTQDRFYYLVLAGVLVSVLLSHRIYQSSIGHALLAIREDELAAGLLGINTTAYKVVAFGIAAGLAGLAGSLFAHYLTYISPENFTSVESILIVTMLIVGGRGNTLGAVVGAGLLVVLPEALRVVNVYRLLIYGLLLVGTAVFRPGGLVGRIGLRRRRAAPMAATLPAPAPARGEGPLLRVEGLEIRFGGLVAVDGVSFVVKPGEVYGVIGPNGAGKTTLFNAISGIAPITRGSLHLGGEDLTGLPPYRRARAGIARTFQNIRAFAGMHVWETVEVGFHAHLRRGGLAHLFATPGARQEAGAVRSAADALLRLVGLEDVGDQLARNLPYGHQRRLEIARALAIGPRLLLLDEPAAGMNESECEELIALVRRIRDQGVTILLVEHHMQVVMAVCDRILVLNFGRPIAEGAPAAIREDPTVNAAYLGTEVSTPAGRADHA